MIARRSIMAAALLLSFSGVVQTQQNEPDTTKIVFAYNAQAGDFTVRYSACIGDKCPAPLLSGHRKLKSRAGYNVLTFIHAKAGLKCYIEEKELDEETASENPFCRAAHFIGLGVAQLDSKLTVEGYKLLAEHLSDGYVTESVVHRGIHLDMIKRVYSEILADNSSLKSVQ